MYLKSIEIQGFKSFANKIRFEFQQGITAIVGPNGSGKSNIADAVRWVLGEQRAKQLRGASMQDVIFAGTELRKPLGYASVAITLDNSDHQLPTEYEEVTVCRRIYRSGESEYLLNGTGCRLRDINELFYDTGIGKEGYSIIGQGQIDRILSEKPEDRRELFDEASGIVKFKRRKETSIRKLDREKDNLVRINDILSELERQVGPLEKQADKARQYLKLHEKMKNLDVNAFLLENDETGSKLEEIHTKESIVKEDLASAQAGYEHARSEYDRIHQEMEGLDSASEVARSRVTQAGIVRSRLEGDIRVSGEQIRTAKENARQSSLRIRTIREETNQNALSQEELLRKKERADLKEEELTGRRKEAGEKLEKIRKRVDKLSEEYEDVKQREMDQLNRRAQIHSRMAALEAASHQLNVRKDELHERLSAALDSREKQQDQIRELRRSFEDSSEKIRQMQERQDQIDRELGGKKSALTQEDHRLQEIRQAYHKEKSRLEALENLAQRYEGFGNSVRKVMQYKNREEGLIGVVADLIKTESRYETAIEIALGGGIQNIVTADETTARHMIDMLKREHAGRATFLPLTSIRSQQEFRNRRILEEQGILGPADTLVTTDPAYRAVASYLLGRIVIADTFDHAAAAARKYGNSVRIVTLEGELFAAGGAISGGAYRNSSNLLGRRREISSLRVSCERRRQEEKASEASIQDIKKSRNLLREENEQLRQEIQQEILKQNTARVKIRQEEGQIREARGSTSQLQKEQQEIEKQILQGTQDMATAQEELACLEKNQKTLSDEEDRLSTDLQQARQAENEASSQVSACEVEVETFRQQQSFDRMNLERVSGDLQRLQDEEAGLRKRLKEAGRLVRERHGQIKKLKEEISQAVQAGEESEARLKILTEQKEQKAAEQKARYEEQESFSERVSALDKECFRLQTQHEKLQETLESRTSYLWEEYEITPSEAAGLRDASLTDLRSLRKEVSLRKKEIKKLGPVNVNAVDEYREVSERYKFLKTQQNDLVEAAQALEKIIEELDESMRKQFRTEFGRIAEEFNQVFRELFGGGEGRLELTEDEDVLAAGIRVIAQPPGKKLQNMMQLSGGEKALTAIALLFAIQNLKPSPFCLLDEIEAALDESNVVRFSSYLHKLTEHTQFIVITHRRGTMEEADRLYGITMQEKGVSTLVSVNLAREEIDRAARRAAE